MWNRPYVPRLHARDLPWLAAEESLGGLAPGAQLRILSRDAGNGAMTCLLRLPPGWSQPQPWTLAADAEYFVLEGALREGERGVRQGAYLHRAAGIAHPGWRTGGGALLYAMWSAKPAATSVAATHGIAALDAAVASSPASGAHPGEAASEATGDWLDTGAMAEHPTPVEGPVPGINVRILRRDAATGGMTLIVAIPRGWEELRSEHHDCVEESYKLSGEIWLRENQRPHVLAAGDYFFRPPRIKHGPMRTREGTASLIRFSGAVVNHYGPIVEP